MVAAALAALGVMATFAVGTVTGLNLPERWYRWDSSSLAVLWGISGPARTAPPPHPS